mmetsp:Transcript_9101/g.23165  ORF Transcript_9101/g.23165 Transcript_9101/m.23165 type:complete len:207 (-) Transcript_9101:237-857(-)
MAAHHQKQTKQTKKRNKKRRTLEVGLLRELLEDGNALLHPLLQVGFHASVSHLAQASKLLRDFGVARLAHFRDELLLLVRAPVVGFDVAQRGSGHLDNVVLHASFVAEFVAHGHAFVLFRIRRTSVPRFLVVVPDGGPATRSWVLRRTVRLRHAVFAEDDIPKLHRRVVRILLRNCIPRRRLLASSASACRGDVAHHERFARVDDA